MRARCSNARADGFPKENALALRMVFAAGLSLPVPAADARFHAHCTRNHQERRLTGRELRLRARSRTFFE